MKNTLFILTTLALLTAAFPALAADEAVGGWTDDAVRKLIENAPSDADYPGAAAVFLRLEDTVELAPDGSMRAWRNSLTKVLSLMGRETYSNKSFLYNSDESALSVTKGVTVRSTGRVVEVEKDAVNDVTPAFLQGATIYANVLEKVVSFPVAGPGSTLELRLEETRKPAKDGSFSGVEYLGQDDPVLDAVFTLRYPAGAPEPRTLALDGAVGGVKVRTTTSPGVQSFSTKGVPGIVPEENMPPATELYPRVVYSSYATWDQAAAFFAGQFFPHVQVDGPVAERAAQATAGLTGADDRIRAVFLDVATSVRSVHLNLGVGGYEPNDASVVLSNRYGDTRDKAVLLVSMLRAAGIGAWPAAVASDRVAADRQALLETVPTLMQFNRLLVAVPDGGGYRFLDPFLDDAAYGYLRWGRGNTALVVKDDGGGVRVPVPAFAADENMARRFMTVVVQPDGAADVHATCELGGYFDRKARMALKDATSSDEKKVFDAAANAVSSGATDAAHSHSDLKDLLQPVRVQQDVRAPDFAVPQGDMMIVRVPVFPYDFASTGIAPTLSERKFPFDYPCEATTELEVKIVVPEGYRVARLPEPVSVRTAVGDFEILCDWHADSRTVLWRQVAAVRSKRIEVGDYAQFKAGHDAITAPKNRLVLLEKVGSPSPRG